MSDDTDWIAKAESLKTPVLVRWIGGWKPGCPQHIAGLYVLERRKLRGATLRGWIAIVISAASLILASYAAFLK